MKKIVNFIDKHPVAVCAILSFLLDFTVESLSRRSLLEASHYITHSPLMFAYNAMIIMFTLMIVLVFKKRMFFLSLISLLWLTCGIINCIVLGFRTTPFSAVDLEIFSSVSQIVKVYLNNFEIVLIIVGIVAVITGMVIFFIKCPKVTSQLHYVRTIASIAGVGVSIAVVTSISVQADALETSFPNIAQAYEDYGFAYCFSNSIIDRGIKEPENYSEENMDNILSKITKEGKNQYFRPNIVMVQLESFIDMNTLKNVTYNENPNPEFSELRENYSSGYVTVPSIGAGTANTEFEVLSGMSLDYFGSSEYPYKTILKDTTSESICYYLKKLNYSTHAIHNNDATFYDRNQVYTNLGFDTFTSLEYMQNVKYNANNWAEDDVLSGEILKAMDSTDDRDFVFTVTVQAHGKYPDQVIDDTQAISTSGYKEDRQAALDYYANQVKGTDDFIRNLVSELENYNEPVVVVFYGDHLPNLEITNDDLNGSNVFQTEYVIWSNFSMPIKNKDLNSFQLTAQVLNILDINGGILTNFHNSCSENPDYSDDLHSLQFDMLYGNQYVYGEESPFPQVKTRLGIDDVTIDNYSFSNDYFIVYGENFTEWSKIAINGNVIDTIYLSGNQLCIPSKYVDMGDAVSVVQQGSDKVILSWSNSVQIG